ncbi:GtrA family protein [Stenotrophomonas indicatrix]|uniref:Putative flippase GtrA (Transmembrane translocase of bactoprenol-linked glucose) n=1 Tax=Stenotrophomonas indicatrix TaxID=2045451 RepID=A0A1W1H1S1_9GAMM|nr:GtrA family protein [Stenotrophomonas indicatrix]SLM25545.1 Putative flippase GtrA (transmembrane translocase of bactoprenol-linked glucose) [Stenotrophomonas indicatrix]
MNRPAVPRQFLLFLIAGGTAAAINFGSRILFSQYMHYVPAIVLAYCLGMITAFTLNKLFVFEHAGNRLHHQILWFVLINLAAVVQTILISLLFARYVFPWSGIDFHNETLAHGIGVAVPVVTSYVGHKYLSFAKAKDSPVR